MTNTATTHTTITADQLTAGARILSMTDVPLLCEAATATQHDFEDGRGERPAVDVTWNGNDEPVAIAAGVRMTLVG